MIWCYDAFIRLIYGCWLSTIMDYHTRCFGLSWAFLRLLWSHLPTGLVSLCSFYFLWKILRRLLAIKTSNTVNKGLRHRHNHNLDTDCPYYYHLHPICKPNFKPRKFLFFNDIIFYVYIHLMWLPVTFASGESIKWETSLLSSKTELPKTNAYNKNPIVCFCCGSAFLAPVSNCHSVFDGDDMESLYLKVYYIAVILNYFNSLVNPIIYALRIPDFKQHLTVCCSIHWVVDGMKSKYAGRSNEIITASDVTSLPADLSHLHLASEQDEQVFIDTKLWNSIVQIKVLHEPSVIKFEVLFLY